MSKRDARLRKRRKFMLCVLAIFIFLLIEAAVIICATVIAEGEPQEQYIRYVVDRGDTLWDIATEYGNGKGTDKFVYRIRKINGIDDCIISPGEVIYIPYE